MASSRTNNDAARKASIGRQKIEIKKVEQNSKRHVTFSKRKLGLFHKATELSILSQAQVLVIVFSQHGKLYVSGHPDPDTVIARYLSGGSNSPTALPEQQLSEATLRRQYEAALNNLQEAKKCLETTKGRHASPSSSQHRFWWDQVSMEGMGLEELGQLKDSMEQLKRNLVAAAEKKKLNSMLPLSWAPTQQEFSYMSLLNDDLNENEAWIWKDNGGRYSMLPKGGFGQY